MEEWRSWRRSLGDLEEFKRNIVSDVLTRGYVEPFTGLTRYPHEIAIRDNDLHESISSHELNSRKRALLVQIHLELQARNWLSRRNLRILGAEALSRTALILRGHFPYYLGTEYLPDEENRSTFFPIVHMDLQSIEYADQTFDAFISGDVFEHIPDLSKALGEISRILKPGGFIVSTFPFDPSREATLIRASLDGSGNVVNHMEPEYHGNPVASSAGSLVFQLPGWDIVPQLRSQGFDDVYFSVIGSSHFGIASDAQPGVFVLTASKRLDSGTPTARPPTVISKQALPDKLLALIALPRSGTTLLTSVFAVHSKCEAIYEPWNGKIVSEDTISLLETIAKVEKLPSLGGKFLFVKETTAFPGSIPGLRRLFDSTPFPVEKHMLMLLRRPEHTFLSEVERRNQWWKDDVAVSGVTFDDWAEKSKSAVQQMLAFGQTSDGCIVLLEDFAARPADLLEQLSQRIGLTAEPQQLEYEKHLDRRRVRGDLNVSESPSKIDSAATNSRAEKAVDLQKIVSASRYAAWFAAFSELYSLVHKSRGIMAIRDIPKAVIEDMAT